jgi:hypothetical protein
VTDALLIVLTQRFGVELDEDSDGGRILGALTPNPPLGAEDLSGEADLAPLTLVPTPHGVTVRAAGDADPLVLALPAGSHHFEIVPPTGGTPAQVKVTLLALTVPAPFLRPAEVTADGTLAEAPGQVELHLPDLLVVVTASTSPPASARLAPATNAASALELTMAPSAALIGPGTVAGFSFQAAALDLDAPGGAQITVPDVTVYVAPPGIPALAVQGGGNNITWPLGSGQGPSGDFSLTAVGGAAGEGARPRFLENVAARMVLDRGSVTLLECSGDIDVAKEVSLRVGQLGDSPSTLHYRLAVALDQGWRVSLTLTADGGAGHLWRTERPDGVARDLPRDTLGAYAVFAPLLAPDLPAGSGYVDLAIEAGAAAGLAASGAVTTKAVTLYGAELVIDDPTAGSPAAFLLLDLETELELEAELGGVPLVSTQRPVKVRHRAIGLRLDFGPDGGAPQLHPVFDRAKGFTVDLADPGLLTVPEPLGDIIQPQGARMARENPLTIELDLGLKADLGIVTIDRSTVRIPLDPVGPPTISALGAHVDVPAGVSGGGYLKLLQGGGLEGSLDASLVPVGVRVAAGLKIDSKDGVRVVVATLEVDLPVPIPLGASGLGLYGFAGLLGVNAARDQAPGTSALDWYLGPAHADATTLDAWTGAPDHWALGLGAVIGTVEGGFLMNAEGMVVIELPGPQLLLVMKANILMPRLPTRGGAATGVLLAVIDVNPHSITIGVVAEYDARPLIELKVPAEAFFNVDQPSDWHLDVGGLPPEQPASVKFLSEFRADGYLMIHGNGIPNFPPYPLGGFSVAAGVHAALTWGPEPIGLYLRISAGADVGISFKPMLIAGSIALRGELHLFVVSIEASADATVLITPNDFYVSAQVCGKVDFFFFDVSGCVSLELGHKPSSLPPPDPLVRSLSLHNRSRPVLHGAASDGPVDGSLGDAVPVGEAGAMPVVPIDAIPVLQLEMRPVVDSECKFLGGAVASQLQPGLWLRRGERFYRYTMKSVELSATQANGAPLPSPVDAGDTPTVWWDRYGKPTAGDDNDVQLALLSWTPDPTPAAAERTTSLDTRISDRWGNLCAEAAPPAPLMWCFHRAPEGPSSSGWAVTSTALPDDPGTRRSSAAAATLTVTEPWRTGDPLADALASVRAAYVFGNAAILDREDLTGGHLLVAPRTGVQLTPAVPGDDFEKLFEKVVLAQTDDLLGDAVRFHAGGLTRVRLLLFGNGRLLPGTLVLRTLADDGQKTAGDVDVIGGGIAQPVPNEASLPPEWRDPSSPWQPLLAAAEAAWLRFKQTSPESLDLALVDTSLPDGTTQIELGLRADAAITETSWGMLLFEGWTTAEETRSAWDSESRQQQIDVVNGFLGADDAKRALLVPDAIYTVTVGYDVDVADADDKGNPQTAGAVSSTGQQQSFRFQTSAAPPARLDPWVLATAPEASEQFVFHGEPLRVVFASGAVRRLFNAYGPDVDLYAVARAASGDHPAPAPAFANTADTPALVLLPFTAALSAAAGSQPCLSGSLSSHERITLELPLDRLTDYVLDIQVGQSTTPPLYPLFRQSFTTSRYESLGALAATVQQAMAQPGHRRVADADPVVGLATAPGSVPLQVADVVFEQALQAVGWGEYGRPSDPRVTLIWRDPPAAGQHYAPVAVLIETPEPLWRARDVPMEVSDAVGTRRFALQARPWLSVVETPVAGSVVSRLVHTTDGARTLVILMPSIAQTGGALALAASRAHHELLEGDNAVETVRLGQLAVPIGAPWEAGQ